MISYGHLSHIIGVDDCAARCEHECIATVDSFECGCRRGYYLLSNLQDCAGIHIVMWCRVHFITYYTSYVKDVDECVTEIYSNCDMNARCINSIGSYECQCRDGFQGNGFICEGDTQ